MTAWPEARESRAARAAPRAKAEKRGRAAAPKPRGVVARANAATPLIEAGRVYLPESASWLFDYIEELSAFPNAKHDDQVDSTTQALSYMRGPVEPEEAIVIFDTMAEVRELEL